MTEQGASILRYKGPSGRLRVSGRHLEPDLSIDEVPAHSFDRVETLSPDEVVEVEIALLPIGMTFHPGVQPSLVMSARNLHGGMMPGMAAFVPRFPRHPRDPYRGHARPTFNCR
ncbi:MAG: hypothetical protein K2X84_16835 [Beijerinckiaceae bacterium]|nr:hypothetical protein [Beijerinckiaceae bacterium]MBY0361896.1 hypothetical protein [Phreatobacter sp.]